MRSLWRFPDAASLQAIAAQVGSARIYYPRDLCWTPGVRWPSYPPSPVPIILEGQQCVPLTEDAGVIGAPCFVVQDGPGLAARILCGITMWSRPTAGAVLDVVDMLDLAFAAAAARSTHKGTLQAFLRAAERGQYGRAKKITPGQVAAFAAWTVMWGPNPPGLGLRTAQRFVELRSAVTAMDEKVAAMAKKVAVMDEKVAVMDEKVAVRVRADPPLPFGLAYEICIGPLHQNAISLLESRPPIRALREDKRRIRRLLAALRKARGQNPRSGGIAMPQSLGSWADIILTHGLKSDTDAVYAAAWLDDMARTFGAAGVVHPAHGYLSVASELAQSVPLLAPDLSGNLQAQLARGLGRLETCVRHTGPAPAFAMPRHGAQSALAIVAILFGKESPDNFAAWSVGERAAWDHLRPEVLRGLASELLLFRAVYGIDALFGRAPHHIECLTCYPAALTKLRDNWAAIWTTMGPCVPTHVPAPATPPFAAPAAPLPPSGVETRNLVAEKYAATERSISRHAQTRTEQAAWNGVATAHGFAGTEWAQDVARLLYGRSQAPVLGPVTTRSGTDPASQPRTLPSRKVRRLGVSAATGAARPATRRTRGQRKRRKPKRSFRRLKVLPTPLPPGPEVPITPTEKARAQRRTAVRWVRPGL